MELRLHFSQTTLLYLGTFCNLALLIVLLYWAASFPVLDALPSCNIKSQDQITALALFGRIDIIALALTFLGVIIAVLAVFGFWAVKSSAVLAAQEEASSCAAKCAGKWMDENMPVAVGAHFDTAAGFDHLAEAVSQVGLQPYAPPQGEDYPEGIIGDDHDAPNA